MSESSPRNMVEIWNITKEKCTDIIDAHDTEIFIIYKEYLPEYLFTVTINGEETRIWNLRTYKCLYFSGRGIT